MENPILPSLTDVFGLLLSNTSQLALPSVISYMRERNMYYFQKNALYISRHLRMESGNSLLIGSTLKDTVEFLLFSTLSFPISVFDTINPNSENNLWFLFHIPKLSARSIVYISRVDPAPSIFLFYLGYHSHSYYHHPLTTAATFNWSLFLNLVSL